MSSKGTALPGRADHGRVYELDLLRFAAAFSVLLFHYAFRGAARDNLTDFHYPAISGFSRYGYLGVDLFFMISGFVIIMSAAGATPRQFVISRLVRLYPAFWVCCSITFLMSVLIGGARFSVSGGQYLINLTMLNGVLNLPSIDGVYWTLTIELHFYLLVFLLLVFRRMDQIGIMLWIWLALAMILRCYPGRYPNFFLIPDYAGYFISGAAFYLVYLNGWGPQRIMLLAGAYGLVLHAAVREAASQSAGFQRPFSVPVVTACVSIYFVVFALVADGRLRLAGAAGFATLGAVTYPLYLIHQFAGYMIFNQLGGRVNPHILFWGVATIMILFAYVVNVQVERRYAKRLRLVLERVLPGGARRAGPAGSGLEAPGE